MRTTRLVVGVMTVALLQACASTFPPPPEEAKQDDLAWLWRLLRPKPEPSVAEPTLEVAKLPPFEGQRIEVKEPLRGIQTVDLAVRPNDLWQRIRQGFRMPDLDNALVKRRTREYAVNRQELQRMLDRSRPYLYHIVEEIEKRGMPTELALLPMVESGFNPMARSPAQASGLWQFVPGTGKMYDLRQNAYYDGRRDIVDSTDAALDYLTKLYRRFGNWHLALASYNWGENAVARAVANNLKAGRPVNFSSLRMPQETRNYVPKLQALKNIISDPAKYGVDLTPIPNERYFTTVLTGHAELDVAHAARLAEMPVQEFKALNPGFRAARIRSPKGTRIVLPSEKIGLFHENLTKYDRAQSAAGGATAPRKSIPAEEPRPREHRVERGDTLSAIALRYQLRLADLKRWNPGVDLLQIGQRIRLAP